MYGDQILNTESINESLSNRQSAKMQYLQKENEQLAQENEDLKDALKMNKEVLRIAYTASLQQPQQPPPNRGKIYPVSSSSSTNSSSKQANSVGNSVSDDIIVCLTKENQKLVDMLSRTAKERNKAQSLSLLNQQIGEESSNFYQEQIAEKEEKIKDLRMLIQDKEFVIQEFEKAKGYYDYGQKVLVRVREITTPNDQSMKLHNEIEQMRSMITKLSEENNKMQEKIFLKEEHLKVLKQEILKLRLVILNPVNYQKMKCFILRNYAEKGDEDAFMCGAFYKEVENQQAEEQNMQQRREQLQYQKEILERQQIPLRPVRGVIANQQQQGQYSPSNGSVRTQQGVTAAIEKSQKLEESLKKMSKLYRKEVENNNILIQKIEEIMKECDQCFNNNEILIESNFKFQTQVEQLHNQIIVLKGLLSRYYKKISQRSRRSISPSSRQSTFKSREYNIEESNQDIPSQQDGQQIEVNVSILEDEEEEKKRNGQNKRRNNNKSRDWETIRLDLLYGKNQKKEEEQQIWEENGDINSEVNSLSKDQAKIYLLNLAKDLYVNTNIKSSGITKKILQQIEIGGYKTGIITLFKTKRSLSNPLDYISDDKDIKYSLKNQLDFNTVLQNNRIQIEKKNSGQQNGYGGQNQECLFNADMSMIVDIKQKSQKNPNPSQKKVHNIQVNASFISNDDIEDLD